MYRIVLIFLNVIYFLYILLATLFYHILVFPLFIIVFRLFRNGCFDDAFRFSNHLFGNFLVRISWPLIRIKCIGRERILNNTPCIVVVNHRSTVDIFLCPIFIPGNTTVFVRSWPFKLLFVGWFMRHAGYIDCEKTDVSLLVECRNLYERGVSFLFFPEGHRSRDGKLQPFRSGAFITAVELDIPVVPVRMTGTEKLLSMSDHILRPAVINIEILPAVHPSSFPVERRAVKLKKHVESLVKECLNE